MLRPVSVLLFPTLGILALPALAERTIVDAVAHIEYVHEFSPLADPHHTRVLIDRHHETIYTNEQEHAHGAHAMLDILDRDGYSVRYADEPLTDLAEADVLIIHGLPNEGIELDEETTFWRSPITDDELDTIVRWVADGGGLFLTLSHFPNGSGGLPLLEAFAVSFRDGYLWHPEHPNFTDPEDRCSHFFGMDAERGLLNPAHPVLAMGEPVEKVDFHCGAAVVRRPEDVILPFSAGARNYNKDETFFEESDFYAGMIGFDYGMGRVVVATDQGMFRNFIFFFDDETKVYVTITSPDNDNGNLFVDLMRWLSPKIPDPAG